MRILKSILFLSPLLAGSFSFAVSCPQLLVDKIQRAVGQLTYSPIGKVEAVQLSPILSSAVYETVPQVRGPLSKGLVRAMVAHDEVTFDVRGAYIANFITIEAKQIFQLAWIKSKTNGHPDDFVAARVLTKLDNDEIWILAPMWNLMIINRIPTPNDLVKIEDSPFPGELNYLDSHGQTQTIFY